MESRKTIRDSLVDITNLIEFIAAESEINKMKNTFRKQLKTFIDKIEDILSLDKGILTRDQENGLRQAQSLINCLNNSIENQRMGKTTNYCCNNKRIASLKKTIIVPGETNVTFDDIAGLETAKSLLEEAIIMPVQYPYLFTGKVKPWKSILMYGPPGTGKSRMAQAVSTEIKSTFFSISSADLLSSWFGESEKLIKELFEYAQSCSNAIIFIDEIDSLCRKRTSQEAETTRRVKTELLKQMEGTSTKSSVFLLCATNHPWELDTAFLRRFSKKIYVPLPEVNIRREIFRIHLKGVDIRLCEKDIEDLANKTDGYSGSDIANCVSEAVLEPIRELKMCTHWLWSADKQYLMPSLPYVEGVISSRIQNLRNYKLKPRNVTAADLMHSIEINKKTNCQDELVRFAKFTEEYGQNA